MKFDNLSKAEIKKRIAIYTDSIKYWTKQKNTAIAEIRNCKDMLRDYKEALKRK